MTQPQDQYPTHPEGPDALRFMDPTVTPESSFQQGVWVEYESSAERPELTTLFDAPGDGYIIGAASPHKFAGASSEVIIRTDKAAYATNGDVFFRLDLTADKPLVSSYEASILGRGISGRIGEAKELPGAPAPEVVASVELATRLVAVEPDTRRRGHSAFSIARTYFEFGREYLDRRKRGLGSAALTEE